MGAGWMGAGWQGAGWFDAMGAGWADSGGGARVFAMRADKPLADFSVPLNTGARFPDFPARYWDPDLFALSILPEFFDKSVTQWDTAIVVPPPAPITQADVDRLKILAVTERPEALGEIVQQHQNFQVSWMQLLMMDPGTHPCTFLLMKLAARVGEVLMMHYKRKYDRPRPSQLCPTLFPPVPVPGHAAYPAGHALISQLTSRCLMDVVPAPLHSSLIELARRVAFNRAIAGLHYESDCTAGITVGDQILPLLKLCPTYQLVLNRLAARPEW